MEANKEDDNTIVFAVLGGVVLILTVMLITKSCTAESFKNEK